MPVLFPRRDPDHVTRPYSLDRTTPELRQATACNHNERLAERMTMPSGSRSRLERDTYTNRSCRSAGFEQWINAHVASKILRSTFPGRLRTSSLDVHFPIPMRIPTYLVSRFPPFQALTCHSSLSRAF